MLIICGMASLIGMNETFPSDAKFKLLVFSP